MTNLDIDQVITSSGDATINYFQIANVYSVKGWNGICNANIINTTNNDFSYNSDIRVNH